MEPGAVHVPARDRQAVRALDIDRECSFAEVCPFAEQQPGDEYFVGHRGRPARGVDHEHARVVGIEIVAQDDVSIGHGACRRLFDEVQAMYARLMFDVPKVKLRLPTRQADQTREFGEGVIRENGVSRGSPFDLSGTQRSAENPAPLLRTGRRAERLQRPAVLFRLGHHEVDLLAAVEQDELERVAVVEAGTHRRGAEDLRGCEGERLQLAGIQRGVVAVIDGEKRLAIAAAHEHVLAFGSRRLYTLEAERAVGADDGIDGRGCRGGPDDVYARTGVSHRKSGGEGGFAAPRRSVLGARKRVDARPRKDTRRGAAPKDRENSCRVEG